MRGVGERMSALALSPDQRTLAAGDPAGNLFLFDTRSRRRVRAPDVHPGDWSIVKLAYSPDGRRLAIAHESADGDIVTLMDTRTRRMGPRLSLDEYERRITGVRFAGATEVDVASSQGDPTTDPRSIVERFALTTGTRVLGPLTLGRQPSPVIGTRDGRRVLTVSDQQLVVRDARTLQPVERIEVGAPRASRNEGAIALSPDDRTAALGEKDGSVRFVDLRDRRGAQGVWTPRRGRDRSALHAGRPLPGHHRRRRRRDRVGRRRRGGDRDAVGSRQRDRGAADHGRQPDALHRRARRLDPRLGPRRHAATRPAGRRRRPQPDGRRAERRRPAAGARPRGRRRSASSTSARPAGTGRSPSSRTAAK